ncbi:MULTISPECIES: cobaltochelatase subunit CobT [Methylobacterium]|uniref:Cobaltochelatase subunit CobT n=4 Tax=Pseudomonadota TaxID=1224 RepID=A0ABQ4SPA2_9HYPH|nr:MULTISPECIES: cobaltochelatase subunit CobT [Methylobacterium]PIU08310.1 MAG: cobaltochelatase subunit CobT [Methylobacterium sp. CG09_land_8_20_14_0_10_71_15]PIU11594.1 MAG: cobaltochelatase subunit CobT [Methylobacterium sp. CG08_land_8_20_14_0_20_71_15]GBU19534.1 cobaltochelatase subunit CobT [Methylobacterium sp.]GJE05051.1 Aerobic cobaltochelatase subunit CobT [Methylobacterium jeotgali]
MAISNRTKGPTRSDPGAEPLKRSVAGCLRAIARRSEIEITYATDRPALTGDKARLPEPPRRMSAADVAVLRGNADSMALRLGCHDNAVHRRLAPESAAARAVFDAVEQARVESIGSRRMPGVASNISAMLEERYHRGGKYESITDRADAPLEDAVALMVRERLTGEKPPAAAEKVVALWRDHVEEKAGANLDGLLGSIEDQRAFARSVRDLLTSLDMADETPFDREDDDNEDENDADQDDQQANEGEAEEQSQGDRADIQSTDEAADDVDEGRLDESDAPSGEMPDEADEGEAEEASESSKPPPQRPIEMRGPPYKVFSERNDETIEAEELCDAEELARLRSYLDKQLAHLQGVVGRLANRLQRRLLAQQSRAWEFDLEEGQLDPARLVRVVMDPFQPLSFKQEKDTDFRDTVVTLLIDNSGSMRGRPITVAATCADILARTLERCGVKVEILGFTTRAWKGGQSREAWLAAGKPANPGRLNDLRHIIYKSADAPWRRARKNLGLMMREGLLKENIDGEALDWAHKRLLGRPEQRKILMVISDGAPVDDSTLSVNAGNYLERHLRWMIEEIETRSPVELLAIGIGHDVTRYYRRAVTIIDAEELGGAMTEKLAELFDEKVRAPSRSGSGRPAPGPSYEPRRPVRLAVTR